MTSNVFEDRFRTGSLFMCDFRICGVSRGPFTFAELLVLARLAAATDYICTNVGTDSSSRFLFRARTRIQTYAHSQ